MAAQPSLVLLLDITEPAVLAAAKAGLAHFATSLCLQRQQASAVTTSAANAAPAPPLAVLGLCNLAKPPQSLKPVLQVRYRPGPFVLRDFHAAVGRLAHSAAADGAMTGAGVAAALQQLVSMVAQDAACAGAGGRKTVMYLSDHLSYDPEDFAGCLEVCRSKGVSIELLFLVPEDKDGTQPGCAAADTLTAAWQAAESAFPHLSVTVVRGASKVSFDALGSTLLQRYVPRRQLAVSLSFKQPLVGSIRSLALSCSAEVQPLPQALHHALLCPCHLAPTWAGAGRAATCALSGDLLGRRQCRLDESTVVVGPHPAGALHLAAPFSLTSLAGGGGPGGSRAASLTVLTRVKVADANTALLFGLPLLLAPQQPVQAFKVVAEGGVVDVSTHQLLELVCSSLSSGQEALLACSSTDLESGTAGLFRLHYLLLPCPASCDQPAALLAKRVASAEELLAPVLQASNGMALQGAAALPPAVAEAVASQLALVPLEQLDPLALSSRSNETVEMLLRESQPMPKASVPITPPAAAAQAGDAVAAPATQPSTAVVASQIAGGAKVAQTGTRGKRAAATAPATARESGGQQGVSSGRKQAAGGAGKGALEFRRSVRR